MKYKLSYFSGGKLEEKMTTTDELPVLTRAQSVTSLPGNRQQIAALKLIENLDLSMIKMKLCLPPGREGKGWDTQFADKCEVWYKRFLMLHILSNNRSIVPTKTIDAMWHGHILDTRKYHADCERIFGKYLHHFPYFGLRGEEDYQNLKAAGRATDVLYEEFFGESPRGLSALCDGGCSGGGGDGDGDCS